MIFQEQLNREKRNVFENFINHHMKYYKAHIFSICYPSDSGVIRLALPEIGWSSAEALRDKYYLEEILFNVHMYIAAVYKRSVKNNNNDTVIKTSNCFDFFANSNNNTFTIMSILSISMNEYLNSTTTTTTTDTTTTSTINIFEIFDEKIL